MAKKKEVFEGGLLSGKRKYIVAAGAIVVAVGAYLVGDIGLADLVTQIQDALGLGADAVQ